MAEHENSSDGTNRIYENIIRIENVTVIDHRIIRIINRVHEAPISIRNETQRFIRYIDSLKQSFIASIIKQKKAEKRFRDVFVNHEICHREFAQLQADNDYLAQLSNEFVRGELERCNVELIHARNVLDTCQREVLLQREQLYLFSRKAEHRFVGFLRKTTDRCWAQMYMCNEIEQRHNSEEIPPPQLIYHVELLEEDTCERERTLTVEGEFDWDATFDDQFLHNLHDQQNLVDDEQQESDIEKQCDVDSHDNSRLYTSEPLYEELLIYRRRCRLVKSMKPKRLIRYFQSIVHGPWEGWEDL